MKQGAEKPFVCFVYIAIIYIVDFAQEG